VPRHWHTGHARLFFLYQRPRRSREQSRPQPRYSGKLQLSILQVGPDLIQRFKELVKVLLKYHDGRANELFSVFAAFGYFDHMNRRYVFPSGPESMSFCPPSLSRCTGLYLASPYAGIVKLNIKLITTQKQISPQL
jgi:hypothetical protein